MSLQEPFSLDLSSVCLDVRPSATAAGPTGFVCLLSALTPDGNSSLLSEYIIGRLRGDHRNLGTINSLEE